MSEKFGGSNPIGSPKQMHKQEILQRNYFTEAEGQTFDRRRSPDNV